jgi:hypothetical protein
MSHSRSASPKRTVADVDTWVRALDASVRDRIVDFLFPPHLGPDDVQHYCNMRLVSTAWQYRLEGCSLRIPEHRHITPFGRNTIPLLRRTKQARKVAPGVEVCIHEWKFGHGLHHPTGAAITVHHHDPRPLVGPYYEDWVRGNSRAVYQQMNEYRVSTRPGFWNSELVALAEIMNGPTLAVIVE